MKEVVKLVNTINDSKLANSTFSIYIISKHNHSFTCSVGSKFVVPHESLHRREKDNVRDGRVKGVVIAPVLPVLALVCVDRVSTQVDSHR